MFEDLSNDADIKTGGDYLGSEPVTSGLYRNVVIKMAYGSVATSGAKAVNLVLETENGRTIRRTEYVSSGTAKGGKNYYEKDGERRFLPGYIVINDLCLLATGKALAQSVVEQKTIPLYNYDEQKEIPTQVQAITSLIGKQVNVGIITQTVDKNAKNSEGKYVPTGETRDEVTISKFFSAKDGRTVTEILAKKEEGEFQAKWEEKWTGVTPDKSKGAKKGTGTPGSAAKGAAPAPSEDDLFANA